MASFVTLDAFISAAFFVAIAVATATLSMVLFANVCKLKCFFFPEILSQMLNDDNNISNI